MYGLGIDTGGTYTDGVIYDFDKNDILYSAKSLTVKEDLTIGINNTLGKLPIDVLRQVEMVSLSTTLATNACVEGKGSRAKLILIGCDEDIVKDYGMEYGLPDASDIIFLDGGHDQEGRVIKEPDWDYLKEKVLECKDKVDAFAVVALWGVVNSEFEKKAKELIIGWTGFQVVCGYELTAVMNSLKRAASTLLNAQLIPIINDFLDAVKRSMRDKEINAPLMIVRGDGSLMSEEFAREKPIETLLSGPSASVAGGINLTGEKNCVIVDMGGTTSDLAIVKNGSVQLTTEGASVGKWKTGTKSILINTVGLGGDSLIRHTKDDDITVGPVRVAPLSWMASRWPETLDVIATIYRQKRIHTVSLCEFFYLVHDVSDGGYYNEEEVKIIKALKDGPLSIEELANRVDASLYSIQTARLERYGVIMRCGLTPTDIMHLTGKFSNWSKDAAYYGAMIMAHQLGITIDELIELVNVKVKKELYYNIIKMLLENEYKNLVKNGVTRQLEDLIDISYMNFYKHNHSNVVEGPSTEFRFTTDLSLVGIGAPIHIFLKDVADALNARCVVPQNAGVANALGAITGNVVVEETVTITPIYEVSGIKGYVCSSNVNREEFAEYDEALEWAKNEAYNIADMTARERGTDQPVITLNVIRDEVKIPNEYVNNDDGEDSTANGEDQKNKNDKLHLETIVSARAVGKVKWLTKKA